MYHVDGTRNEGSDLEKAYIYLHRFPNWRNHGIYAYQSSAKSRRKHLPFLAVPSAQYYTIFRAIHIINVQIYYLPENLKTHLLPNIVFSSSMLF